jgi:hypothetical protein
MTDQPSLFDAPQGFTEGMRASQASADTRWTPEQIQQVDAAILKCRHFAATFTADDVWRRLPSDFPVTKGMAARLNSAARRGLIENTGTTTIATRGGKHDHGQRLTVWRSL